MLVRLSATLLSDPPASPCVTEALKTVKDAFGAIGGLLNLIDRNDFGSVIKLINDFQKSIAAGALALSRCSGGTLDPKTTEKFKNIISAADKVLVIAECSLAIVEGLAFLGLNTRCAWFDSMDAFQSARDVQAARQRAYPTDGSATPLGDVQAAQQQPAYPTDGNTIQSADGSELRSTRVSITCGNEPPSCSRWAMGVLGQRLWEEDILGSRSGYCAKSCSNSGYGGDCAKFAPYIFASSPACGEICNTKQCPAAVQLCVSMCCNQDGDCTAKANKKIRENGW